MVTVFLVALGGALGSLGRHYVGVLLSGQFGHNFPYGTLVANSLGGFFILFFITLFVDRLSIDPMWRVFLASGFLGGFTTFSSFTYDTLTMMIMGDYVKGFLNLFLNIFLAFLFGGLGFLTARFI